MAMISIFFFFLRVILLNVHRQEVSKGMLSYSNSIFHLTGTMMIENRDIPLKFLPIIVI
jgi:hypothetical protein